MRADLNARCPRCGQRAVDFRGTDENPTAYICDENHEWPPEKSLYRSGAPETPRRWTRYGGGPLPGSIARGEIPLTEGMDDLEIEHAERTALVAESLRRTDEGIAAIDAGAGGPIMRVRTGAMRAGTDRVAHVSQLDLTEIDALLLALDDEDLIAVQPRAHQSVLQMLWRRLHLWRLAARGDEDARSLLRREFPTFDVS